LRFGRAAHGIIGLNLFQQLHEQIVAAMDIPNRIHPMPRRNTCGIDRPHCRCFFEKSSKHMPHPIRADACAGKRLLAGQHRAISYKVPLGRACMGLAMWSMCAGASLMGHSRREIHRISLSCWSMLANNCRPLQRYIFYHHRRYIAWRY
jgi:hypothetical protein